MATRARISDWIKVFRLRTLPLSLASILMGIAVAYQGGVYAPWVWFWAVVCVLFLQILSNIANDYGDGVKGTDNVQRLGPQRGIQSGLITPLQMKKAMFIFAALAFVAGLVLLYVSSVDIFVKLSFLALGLAAIVAAIFYTVGNKAYGYHGMGDLFVFVFFGMVAVLGTIILSGLHWGYIYLLPAVAMGAFSVAVLNINNMRDIENDKISGKHTLAVYLGRKYARWYHMVILLLALGSMACFVADKSVYMYLPILLFAPLFLRDGVLILKEKEDKALDKYLKRTAIFTLGFVVCFALAGILQ